MSTVISFWNNNHPMQGIYEELNKLIPASGECAHKYGRNKHLEALRKAANAYYDMFNNGATNRASSIAKTFGFSPRDFMATARSRGYFDDMQLFAVMDPVMERKITAAYKEQFEVNPKAGE